LLRLKRLELQGFKSFCDRTEMRFNGHGIAAIVGPNGCGKSNLSDAISWVLGEQSAKSLRGSRMEDVIFAGTRDRKPLGMATVTLTMVDPTLHQVHVARANGGAKGSGTNGSGANGHGAMEAHLQAAAAAHHGPKQTEITITRRLFRSGDSEYLIDGRIARLRDIQDLFMGTGLGPESYAIIEQGRIGQILSSKPQDRRAVIEEAAGVTKFKTKRRLAEAKLESAKQNLTRVFDILEEVGRQANSLKRQASKARRYEELKAELSSHLRRLLSGRYRLLEREAAKTALDLNVAAAEFQKLSAQVAGQEQEHHRMQAQGYQLESDLTEVRRLLAERQVDAERTRGRMENQAQQIASIESRLGQGEIESQELGARIAALECELETLAGRVREFEAQVESSRARLAEKSRERERLQEDLRSGEEKVEGSRQAVLRLLGEAATLRNQLAQIEEYLAGIDRDSARAQKEEQSAAADSQRLTALKNELGERMAARQIELLSITAERERVETELADRRARLSETRQQLERLRTEFSDLRARRDSLTEILSHRAYTTEAVKRLFTAIEQGQAGDLRPLGVLADFVEVDRAFEKAAEEFLHDELEYVIVESWGQADGGIDVLRLDLEGRATFLVHPPADQSPWPSGVRPEEPAIGPETGIAGRLSGVLRLTNGLTHAPVELLPRLARCFLAEDRASAQRLAQQYPDLFFLLPDGVCYHGQAVSGGKKASSGPLALKRELRELNSLVPGRQADLEASAALLESLEREIAGLEEALERLRASQQGQEKETLALDHEMRKLAEEFSRANARLSVARLELERLRVEKERSAAQRESIARGIEEKEQDRREQEWELESARGELERLQASSSRVVEEHSALRAELAGLEERLRAEQDLRSGMDSRHREMVERCQEIASELERLGVERARLLADNIELDRRAALLAQGIEALERKAGELAAQESEARAALAAIEESLKQLRLDAQQAQERRSRIELDLVRRQAELKFLDETSRKDLNVPVAEIADGQEPAPDEIELAAIEQRHDEVKARIEALGPVNPQALEEYEEARQRYDFLNTQRQDLLDSIRDTEKAIQEIDVEARKRFSEAFEAVNTNFREMFKTLFGGGSGEMRLTDESNVGESGIDIVASPPGKRLQNVLLLSGGEKALTALALLMAIFKYQPSPFCILDEVDAPLDEPNIQRLTRLLKEMSDKTQFIVITHAKRTMEAAQALYGVTMQEPGVSRLVSVRFDTAPSPPPPPALENGSPDIVTM
jgi:chromosome segregation protein